MRRQWAATFGLLAVVVLAACGGGGGGGSSGVSYSGLTTPAAIDNTNAEEIALAAWFGGEMSDPSFLTGTLGQGGAETGGTPSLRVLPLLRALRSAAESVVGESRVSPMGQARPQARVYGQVSGYMDVGGSWNGVTGEFSYTISFRDFDDGIGIVLSGSIQASGRTSIYYDPNPQPGDILEMTIRCSSFAVTDGVETVRMGGTMAFLFNVPTGPVVATLTLVVKDETTGESVWIRDYTVTVTDGSDLVGLYTDVTISGRIYLHDHGYVDIVTIADFRVYEWDDYPSSGILVVTGKAVGGGYCRARLYVIDNTGYAVYVDADGDGTYADPPLFGSW